MRMSISISLIRTLFISGGFTVAILFFLQFQRVLSELELNSLITGSEYNIIFHKFEQNVGGRLDVNYIAFCDTCYSYAEAQAKPKD